MPQATVSTTGLGPTGTLQSATTPQSTLLDAANTLTASQAGDSAQASSQTTDATAVQSSLQTKLTGATGVDVDTELGQLVVLQNAYGANAKIITAIQALFTDVLDAVSS